MRTMIRYLLFFLLVTILSNPIIAQNHNAIRLDTARFSTCNQSEWKDSGFNDRQWKTVKTNEVWQNQGYPEYHGYAWYRIHVRIPSSLKNNSFWKDSLRVYLAHVNDADETYLNGKLIGKTGGFPDDAGGYASKWPAVRNYIIAANNPAIKWDQENIIAVKVYDGGGTGGIFMGEPFIDMLEKADGIEFKANDVSFLPAGISERELMLVNKFNVRVKGSLHYIVKDASQNKIIKNATVEIDLAPSSTKSININFPAKEGIELACTYTEASTGNLKTYTEVEPYLLTPAERPAPLINAPKMVGFGIAHPILYHIPVTGKRPLQINVTGLPQGVKFNPQTGIISGQIDQSGEFLLTVKATNSFGSDQQNMTLKIGDKIALTPPMGWNSWNCYGLGVSSPNIKIAAQAIIKKGLMDYGWNYINIDDGWQAKERLADGEIEPNAKFADMGLLGNYLHEQGLKFGIYSSPGARTCGGFLGSLGYEGKDASTYNRWGVDYLKYDLCSYSDNIGTDTTLYAQQKPYILMRDELKKQPRDIFYSLCQYGIKDVWKWGRQMNGNSWRTTEDITDTWESLYHIGFSQNGLARYAHPGGWNDVDMLIVGSVGWGENLHASRLTPYEQYTHISLWCLLSAPLLIGCDMGNLDEFTLNLLKNRNVIAIDQDELGAEADRVVDKGGFQVWVKPMADGSKAIGIFNLNDTYADYTLNLIDVVPGEVTNVREVWTQKKLNYSGSKINCHIPPHGVKLIQVQAR